MLRNPNLKPMTLLVLLPLAVGHGCDDRVAHLAREAADRQAQQNTAMAELNKEVASGTHKLVAADAEARKDIVGVHHDLQQERTRLDTDRTDLEAERQQIAGERRTESMLVAVMSTAGGLVLAVLLIAFCRHLLTAAEHDSSAELHELVVSEMLGDSQPLLPSTESSGSLLAVSSPNDLQPTSQ